MDERKTTDVGGGASPEREGEAGIAEAQALARQRMIPEVFGTIDYDPDYDYKAARRKNRSPTPAD